MTKCNTATAAVFIDDERKNRIIIQLISDIFSSSVMLMWIRDFKNEVMRFLTQNGGDTFIVP